jgi:hypothetical protein
MMPINFMIDVEINNRPLTALLTGLIDGVINRKPIDRLKESE